MTTKITPESPVFNPTTGELDKLAATYATGAKLAARAATVHSIRTRAESAGERILWEELALAVAGAVVAKLYTATPGDVLDMVDTKGAGVSADTLKQAGYAAEWLANLGVSLTQNMPLLGRVVSAWATVPAKARKDFAAVIESGAPAELDGEPVAPAQLSANRAELINEQLATVLATANAAKAAQRAASKAAKIAAQLAAEAEAEADAAEHAEFTGGLILDPELSAYEVCMAALAVLRDNMSTLDDDDAQSVRAELASLVGTPVSA